MDMHTGPRRIGNFTVIEPLGRGGMGVVYLCRTPGGQRLAVKVIRDSLSEHPEIRLRFAREVAALREVHSPYTVPVYAAETQRPPLWLATRYVDGPTLRQRVHAEGPLDTRAVIRFGLMLAEALATVHERGVIHRDLKPGNILFEGDEPRLIDFGIARSAAAVSGLTDPGVQLGTSGYMAAEQLAGHKPSPAVDVFALGAVLTYAATGMLPFGQGQAADDRIRRRERPDLGGLGGSLRRLVAECLAHDPLARPGPQRVMSALTACGAEEAARREAERDGPSGTGLLLRRPPGPPGAPGTPGTPEQGGRAPGGAGGRPGDGSGSGPGRGDGEADGAALSGAVSGAVSGFSGAEPRDASREMADGAHECHLPGQNGGCVLHAVAAGLLDAGLTPALIRKALVRHDH
ncbi:serine/threonine-protein kinase [Streptomyces sp. SID8352]|uniref:serine/threonine-protein kinase n=1 Tax=Streptomyces sp. SID8352 TaxID=2690338 RepID=UPI00136FA78D|nr:serine/threonine-protein kinase [Streptomyces sp. SID8352]MYU21851.1 protein kinase [Streptomyces sp. SID8352]